jgi:hypothetical protein
MSSPPLALMRKWLIGLILVVCVVAIHEWLMGFHSLQPIVIAIVACVATVFGLGAMRRPWFFLGVIVVLWVASPKVFDSDVHELYEGGYQLAWLMGAPAGWVLRRMRQPSFGDAVSRELPTAS